MEIGTLFTSTKWELLREIAQKPSSPLQLAEKLDTSIANVSQQLRLLEAVGLVKKERVQNRDRGKPRSLYSLTQDVTYVIVINKDRQEKGLLSLTGSDQKTLANWIEKQDTFGET